MFTQLSLALNSFIDNDLGLASDQKNLLIKKHKLHLADSLDKGHWTTNLCLVASGLTKTNPKELAVKLAAVIGSADGVDRVEIAGPGFVNIFLTQSAFLQQVEQAVNLTPSVDSSLQEKIQIEFVSANPTGPLHVGHGRGAAYGDAIARILSSLGHQVEKEYYVNDAGRQVDILACSIFLRKFSCFDDASFPASGYKGSYVLEIADSIKLDSKTQNIQKDELCKDLPKDPEAEIDELITRIQSSYSDLWPVIRSGGLTYVTQSIKDDLTEFKVEFDQWFFESSLGELSDETSAIAKALHKVKQEHAYEKAGAVWLESTKFGDDKDRVIIRENGRGTYLSADLAYHKNKLDRGFDTIINVWGSDHHGYIKRIEATIEAMGYHKNQMQVQLVQFANLFEDGAKVKMSTRSGNFYTLKQLIDDIGTDAARFYYLSKQADQHLDFDIGVARSHSKDNLYYYVQYAHARICSVQKKYMALGNTLPEAFKNFNEFHACDDLIQLALNFPFVVKGAGENLQPHLIIYYLRDLAQGFHHFYNDTNILKAAEQDQVNMLRALDLVKNVIASSLELIGIESLEKM